MTNTIYTLENLNKIANKMVKVWGIERDKAEGLAEFNLKYQKHNDIKRILKTIN